MEMSQSVGAETLPCGRPSFMIRVLDLVDPHETRARRSERNSEST